MKVVSFATQMLPIPPPVKESAKLRRLVFGIQEALKNYFGASTPWRNIKKFRQLRFFKSFWHSEKHCSQWRKIFFKRYSPVQRRSHGNIYIEKFANIGTSELCWDISGLFLDDRDISGFLLINSIIVHMTGHFL